jgi:hypothetical protein
MASWPAEQWASTGCISTGLALGHRPGERAARRAVVFDDRGLPPRIPLREIRAGARRDDNVPLPPPAGGARFTEEMMGIGRVGVEIRAPRLDDGLVQQPGFGELVQRIVNGRQDTRIPEVTASPCNCSAMTWRSPMPESAEASSQLTHRWRETDSNLRSPRKARRFRRGPFASGNG